MAAEDDADDLEEDAEVDGGSPEADVTGVQLQDTSCSYRWKPQVHSLREDRAPALSSRSIPRKARKACSTTWYSRRPERAAATFRARRRPSPSYTVVFRFTVPF